MKILVDTSVWPLALRRNLVTTGPEVSELIELIREVRVGMIGPVRQELLSGIKSQTQFQKLRNPLRAFPDAERRGPRFCGIRENGYQFIS